MSSKPQIKTAILGAGPGGLTLASLLSLNLSPNVTTDYTIFDLRPRPSPEQLSHPSGSLDLHAESGLLALAACNLTSQFQALKQECSEASIIADANGTVHWSDEGFGDRPEIARNKLTELLLSGVPEERIRWGCKVVSLSESISEESFDLVIGSDGAHSRVRSLLTQIQPHYSSISCLTLTIPQIRTSYPHLSTTIGTGSFMAMGHCKAVMSQRGAGASARVYLMLRTDSESFFQDSGIGNLCSSPEKLKEKLLGDEQLFGSANWGNGIRDLIAAGCDAETEALALDSKSGNSTRTYEREGITARPLYMLPTDFTWTHKSGLTLLGDAAHLMTPFAGEGVNCAMLDALELSKAISSSLPQPGSTNEEILDVMDRKIEVYEKEMWTRVHPIQEETLRNLHMMMDDVDAPKGFVEWMRGMIEAGMAGDADGEGGERR
ncbi:hypothetical protein BKA64DRAFT_586586 [Cadophora sp. MPI-SDFR-AT-0126]|nr:hypothetical protein BKA64DRAFT_586586 [Leotiomycetes sp. MPI-SDFR-AT-0126]